MESLPLSPILLACVALFLGPMVYQILGRGRAALQVIDGFVFVSISGLLLMHLFSAERASSFQIATLVLLVLGIFGPLFLEHLFRRIEKEVHVATMVLGAIGFCIHTMMDGAALAFRYHEGAATVAPEVFSGDLPLAAAIIIHRLPVGLTLWWLLKPRFGPLAAGGALLFAVGATVFGYLLAEHPTVHSFEYTFPWIEAFVAGSILHVVFFRFHAHGEAHEHSLDVEDEGVGTVRARYSRWVSYEGIGNVLGCLLLGVFFFLFPEEHGHHLSTETVTTPSVWENFFALAIESAPALLFAYGAGIFIYGFFPERSLEWMKRGGRLKQAGKGMLVGLPLPICSCGVLPYYQTLIRKGAPPASAVAFLIATPELGIDAVLLSFPLLGLELTVIRLGASACIAFLVAWILSGRMSRRTALPVLNDETPQGFWARVTKGAQFSLVELVDTTAPWMLVGLLLAAFAAPAVQAIGLSLAPGVEVLIFSLLGLVVYVCASGATPLVAALLAAGVSPGAGLAFLLTGPATNISTFGVLSKLHGRSTALLFAALMMGAAITVGFVTNAMLPTYESVLSTHHSGEHHQGTSLWETVQYLSLVLLALLFLSSVLRQGGRNFLGHVFGDQHSNHG
ncbi:permease [bacterium]|nr:permease [bacterium]